MKVYKYNIILLASILQVITGFNIDRDANRLNFTITPSLPESVSQFGYSIAFFNTSRYKLLVGAPEYANKSGAVYECDLTSSSTCSEIAFSKYEHTKRIGENGGAEQLGRSVKTTKSQALVCSPMWNDETTPQQNGNIPLYGRCVTLNKTLGISHINSPCHQTEITRVSNDLHGYCQTGISSGFLDVNDESYTILANVGSWRYRGSLVATKGENVVSRFTNLQAQNITNRVAIPARLSPLNFTDIHSLLGYATASGAFMGPNSHGIASGAPRGKTLLGEVLVYDFKINDENNNERSTDLNLIATIKNPNTVVGTLFGASVAAIDYNGDGYDDLVIGAPIYAAGNGNLQGQDEGRAYIYRNEKNGKFVLEDDFLFGSIKSGRFGTTITNIGDINGDKTDDIAIGAPFGGSDGNGAVFIYNVRNKTIQSEPSQIIESPGARGFGFSIAAEKVDTRIYPALAVGAPLDGQVYMFQAKTVITLKDLPWVNSTLVPPEATKSNCHGPNDKKYHCIAFRLRLDDMSSNPPSVFDVRVKISMDTSNTLDFNKRAFLLDSKTNKLVQSAEQNIQFQRGGTVFINRTIYFSTEKTTDFGSPVMITTEYFTENTERNCENGLCAILDQFGATEGQVEVKYLRKCGSDDKCDIDLAIEQESIKVVGMTESDQVLIGSVNEEVLLSATVTNRNESAYLSRMNIRFNKDFDLVQIKVNEKNVDLEDNGGEQKNNSSMYDEIKFLLANPILIDERYEVKAKFALRSNLRAPSAINYDFNMEVFATGTDYNMKNNNKTVSLKSGINSCLEVRLDGGVSEGSQALPLIYNPEQTPVSDIRSVNDVGPLVEYNFLIQNNGRRQLEDLEVEIKLIDTYDDLQIVYVYELRGESPTQCNTSDVNNGNYQISSTQALVQDNTTDVTDKNVRSSRRRRNVNNIQYSPNLNCLDGKCKKYSCSIPSLKSTRLTSVKVSFAIYLSSLQKLKSDRLELELNVTFGKRYGRFLKQSKNCKKSVTVVQPITPNRPTVEPLKKKVEWWIILVAVVGALIILAIFCAILYRIGFFKRNRLEDQQELPVKNDKYQEKNPAYDED